MKPLLSTPGVEFIGEIDETQKQDFLGGALALLFPVDWPEPFGLVMIEALACGTPVIARPAGSVPEILRHGVSGFIESSVEDLVGAVQKVRSLSRLSCRDEFERRFTAEIMADNYEKVYSRLVDMAHGAVAQPVDKLASTALAREAARHWNGDPRRPEYEIIRPPIQNSPERNTLDNSKDY